MAAPTYTYSGNVYSTSAAGTVDFPLISTAGNAIQYLEASHVHVYSSANNGSTWTELTRPTQWNFVSGGTVARLASGIAAGAWIKVKRITPIAGPYVTFQASSLLTAEQLNDESRSNSYVNQETLDDADLAAGDAAGAVSSAAAATATANTALSTSNTALSTANTANSTANAASSTAATSLSTSQTALANSQAAVSSAASAVTTSQTAAANATTALATSQTASTNAAAAVSTANTASTNASTALSTANTSLANSQTASQDASTALTNSQTSLTQSASAVTTANNSSTVATNASTVATAAAASAASATTTANNANTKADQAIAAVSSSINYTLIANVAAIPASPSNNTYIEVSDSTGIESFTPLTGRPAGFVGDSGLTVRLVYTTAGATWNWLSYFPSNAETRYLKLTGGSLTGAVTTTGTSTAASFIPTSSTAPSNGLYLSGTNAVALATNSTGRLFVDASGNVGVGAAPSQRLSVFSGTSAGINNVMILKGGGSSAGNGAGLILSPDSANTYANWYGARLATAFGGASWGCDLIFSTNNNSADSNLTEAMRLTSAGRLGLGSSSPAGLLHLGNGSGNPDIILDKSEAGAGTLKFYKAGSASAYIQYDSGEDLVYYSPSGAGSHVFYTGGNARVTINNSGAVGIGASSVTAGIKFQVQDGTASKAQFNVSGYGGLVIGQNADLSSEIDQSSSGAKLYIKQGGTTAITVDTSQRVGIGTTTADRKLHVRNDGAYALKAGGESGSAYYVEIGQPDALSSPAINYTGTGASLRFQNNGSDVARFDSSGRLLVGTSSASGSSNARAIIAGNTNSAASVLQLASTSSSPASGDALGVLRFSDSGHTQASAINCERDGGTWTSGSSQPTRLVFSTTADGASSPTERMRISNAGRLMIGGTTATSGSQAVFFQVGESTDYCHIERSGPSSVIEIVTSVSTTSARNQYTFKNSNGTVGNIQTSGSSTSFLTSSDYRLKENIIPLTGAISRVNQLQVHRFNFIADPDKIVDGFLAHEAQEVVPECATGTKDEVDADGNPVYQGIDQSKLVPLLTAALQEALQKIEDLEGRLTAAGL